MNSQSPVSIHQSYAEALNRGDMDALLRLYEPNAILVTGTETAVQGRDAIRESLMRLVALQPEFEITTVCVFENGDDLALLKGKWSLTGVGPEGSAVVMTGDSSEVVRRQTDGSWLVAIADPGKKP